MKTITAKEFDEKFDNGEDISEYLDFSKATRPNALKTDTKKVNVDFPQWVIESLDKEAKKIGVTRLLLFVYTHFSPLFIWIL